MLNLCIVYNVHCMCVRGVGGGVYKYVGHMRAHMHVSRSYCGLYCITVTQKHPVYQRYMIRLYTHVYRINETHMLSIFMQQIDMSENMAVLRAFCAVASCWHLVIWNPHKNDAVVNKVILYRRQARGQPPYATTISKSFSTLIGQDCLNSEYSFSGLVQKLIFIERYIHEYVRGREYIYGHFPSILY